MRSTRRGALAIAAATLTGCTGRVDRPSETDDADGSGEDDGSTALEDPLVERVVNLYVYDTDEGVVATEETGRTASRTDDLGRAVNDAQSPVARGNVVLATGGRSETPIAVDDGIELCGVESRPTLTPDENVEHPFDLVSTADGPSGGRVETLELAMERRGRSAARCTGFADLTFVDLLVTSTVDHGLHLDGGRGVEVRDCRFEDVGDDAIRIEDSSQLLVEDCELVRTGFYGVYARGSSDVTVRNVRSTGTRFNSFAMYDYTEDWQVVDCAASGDGHAPFAASPALNGSFVDCEAEGIDAEGEGGFEIEYKAGHDREDLQRPVEGCSVVSCTAIDCNMGFYAREDDREYETGTPVIRPRFVDCTAVNCDTGLFIDDNVVEAIVRGFEAVECEVDVVDEGTRTIVDGRSENAGDPAVEGQWNGHAEAAAELDVVVENTEDGTLHEATEDGNWTRVS